MERGYTLIILSQAPYRGSGARAALDLALSYAAFGQAPRVLFVGDGVLQLLPEQDPTALGRRSLGKVIDSLPLYDVDDVYVRAADIVALGLANAALPTGAIPVDDEAVRALRAGARHMLSL